MRLFNLAAGAPVLTNVDVCGEAGDMNKEVVKEFKGIRGDETLTISLGAQKMKNASLREIQRCQDRMAST